MPFIWIFSFSTGLVPNRYDYMRFLVCLWLTNGSPNGSFKWTGAVWWSKPVHLSEFVRTHIIQIFIYTAVYTTKNTVILPNFVVWKFCGKAQFPHSFRQFARNYAETVPFYKISTHGIFCSVMYVLFTPCVYGVCKSLVIPATMRWRASPLLTVKNMLFDVTSDLTFKLLYKMID